MGLDKFAWIKALYADSAVSFRGKTIGAFCAIAYVTHGEEVFSARQDTIAARCGTTRKTVNLGLRDVREAGYLVKNRTRAQGAGRHGGDEWRLVLPEWCNQSVHHFPSAVTGLGQHFGQSGVTETAEWCNPPASPTSTNDPPKGFKKGFKKGFEEGSGENPSTTTQEQEPRTAPNGASLEEKKPRPQLGGMVHAMLKKTNPTRAVPPPPSRNDSLREEHDRYVERQVGIPDCQLCDDDGDVLSEDGNPVLDNDGEPLRCWHGKEPA